MVMSALRAGVAGGILADSLDSAKKTETLESVENELAQKKLELEEKIKLKQQRDIIEQKKEQIESIDRMLEILDCEDYDEAWELAETKEEEDFVNKYFDN